MLVTSTHVKHTQYRNGGNDAECHSAECRGAECRGANVIARLYSIIEDEKIEFASTTKETIRLNPVKGREPVSQNLLRP